MSKKHYIAIAKMIKTHLVGKVETGILDAFLHDLVCMLKQDNVRFDSNRFVKACIKAE